MDVNINTSPKKDFSFSFGYSTDASLCHEIVRDYYFSVLFCKKMVKLSDNARNATDRIKLVFVTKSCVAASEGKEQPIYKVKAQSLKNYNDLVNDPNFNFGPKEAKYVRCDEISAEEQVMLKEELKTSFPNGEEKVSPSC